MIKVVAIYCFLGIFALFASCKNEENVVFIFDNQTNNSIAYFKPLEFNKNTNIYSTSSKEIIGTFDRKIIGQKNFIIRKDGGDVLYFTEIENKGSVVYIFNPKSDIWGYFYQF
jgi:hypothetical protein